MTDDTEQFKKSYTLEYQREYYERNRERILERTKEYAKRRRAENPERVRELERSKVAAWRKNNPEKAKEAAKRGRDAARQRAVEYVNAIKEKTPCADCGKYFPPVCMDFDHINGDKEHSIGALVGQSRSIDAIQREIDKCELVCSNCHRIRTYRRLQEMKGATQHDDND